jgi:hypothetical protein
VLKSPIVRKRHNSSFLYTLGKLLQKSYKDLDLNKLIARAEGTADSQAELFLSSLWGIDNETNAICSRSLLFSGLSEINYSVIRSFVECLVVLWYCLQFDK